VSVVLQGSLWRPGLPPGVYQEAAPAVSRPRVRLDVAALIGLAERGPLNTPVAIDDARHFETVFGRALPGLNLPLAVRLFFANGGRRCVVVRCVDHRHVRTARLSLPGLSSVHGRSRRQARLAARNPGAWGNGLALRCRLLQRPLPLALQVGADGHARVDLPADLPVGSILRLLGRPARAGGVPRQRLFRIVAGADGPRLQPSPGAAFLRAELLRNAVLLGVTLTVFLDGRQVESWDDAALHPDHPRYLPRLLGRRSASEALRPPLIGVGETTPPTVDRLWGGIDEPWGSEYLRPSALLIDGTLLPSRELLAAADGLSLSMAEVPLSRRGRDAGESTERRHFFEATEMDAADLAEDADHQLVAFKQSPGALDALQTWDDAFPFEPAALLTLPDLLHPSPPAAQRDPAPPPDDAPCFAVDCGASVAVTTRPLLDFPRLGFDAAALQEAQGRLVAHCQAHGGRIAMLDLPPRLRAGEIVDWRRQLASDRAALYAPWLRVDADGTAQTVPPAAAACGIAAQLENRIGAWAAPANLPVSGAFARADDAGLPEPGFLFAERIDEVRASERGLLLLGARTTSNDPLWTHLSVRRLIDWLQAQLAADLAWAPFEPNNAALWSAMAATARRRLRHVFDAGALAGNSEADSYFVRCDATTSTPTDLDAGRAVMLIGVAPAVPAEFIVFRLLRHGADDPRLEIV